MRTKPGFGIMPKYIWIENRIDEIFDAMWQYREGKYIIPIEWVEELVDHLKEMEEYRNKKGQP